MLKLTLTHYGTGTIISANDDGKRIGVIVYTNNAHKPLAQIDFERIRTELYTYGDKEALEEFERIRKTKENERRAQNG